MMGSRYSWIRLRNILRMSLTSSISSIVTGELSSAPWKPKASSQVRPQLPTMLIRVFLAQPTNARQMSLLRRNSCGSPLCPKGLLRSSTIGRSGTSNELVQSLIRMPRRTRSSYARKREESRPRRRPTSTRRPRRRPRPRSQHRRPLHHQTLPCMTCSTPCRSPRPVRCTTS